MKKNWLEIDEQGYAALAQRREKGAVVAEVISNAWDSGTERVEIRLTPVIGRPLVTVEVEDWGEGFQDMAESYTVFSASRRAGDVHKRGRFNRGEKDVLSIAEQAEIVSVGGTIQFDSGGRRKSKASRPKGTLFKGDLRMTREEYGEVLIFIERMIPPVETTVNGKPLARLKPEVYFEASLLTEVVDENGVLRRRVQKGVVEVYDCGGESGEILELGVPVVECSMPYRINVLQKVPLNSDRDNVPPSYLKQLQVTVLNHIHNRLDEDQAKQAWVQEATADGSASKAAVESVFRKKFGELAVSATPNDPAANAKAASQGYAVIQGGAMSSGQWSNVKKHGLIVPASQAFPTPTAEQKAAVQRCPTCGR